MPKSGLTSITFRKLAPSEVISWVALAGLQGIEWGGDIHVPPGALEQAREVARMTRDAGLEVTSYGSYYRLGEAPESFQAVLDSALALGAPIIRVWAGRTASADATPEFFTQLAADGKRIAQLAQRAGVKLACEWHEHSLSDELGCALRLHEQIGNPHFGLYWQPRTHGLREPCLEELRVLRERGLLLGVHVFSWSPGSHTRLPLRAGADAWKEYLKQAQLRPEQYAWLEFVVADDPQNLLDDAAALNEWLRIS